MSTKKMKKLVPITARCEVSERDAFQEKSAELGWENPSVFMRALCSLVNSGKLHIPAPKVPEPTITLSE